MGSSRVRPDSVVFNLGCGTRTSPHCTNVDWTPYARVAQRPWLVPLVAPLLGRTRGARLRSMSGRVVAHDLRRGVPAPDASVDAVYLSHVVEHIDRDAVQGLLVEVLRVLRPGGTVRIVVPDLHALALHYLESRATATEGRRSASAHEDTVAAMLEQSVRRDSRAVPDSLTGLPRRLATRLIGDARRRGETHQWMYDDVTLCALLEDCGFVEPSVVSPTDSMIVAWEQIDLDRVAGAEYLPGSLYVEAVRPSAC